MNCHEAHEHLLHGDGEAVAEHASKCAACTELWASPQLQRALREAPPPAPFDEAMLWQGMERELAREGRWTRIARNGSVSERRAFVFGLLAIMTGAIGIGLRRPDFERLPVLAIGTLVVATIGVALGVWVSLRPVHRVEWSDRLQWGLGLFGAGIALVPALIPEWHSSVANAPVHAGPGILRAAACFGSGTIFAALLLLVVAAGLQGRRGPSWISVAAWASAGMFSTVALTLHCPIESRDHLLVGHASISLVPLAVVLLLRVQHRRQLLTNASDDRRRALAAVSKEQRDA
jgi:hypothetical protein